MSNEIDDGGRAFPSDRFENTGMSLRDYFAGRVIVRTGEKAEAKEAAELAYKIADAMIAARKPAGPGPETAKGPTVCEHKHKYLTKLGGVNCLDCPAELA